MALTLSASTFQRGTAFQVAILGAADRSRVVAFSSDGESLTTRPLFILGDDRHNFQVGWLLTGTYRATGTPTISLVEYPFNSTTGTTSAVAATVQAGAVTPTVALATFPYTGMGPFYAYVQDAPSATVAVNAFSSDGISVRAYSAFFSNTNRATVGYVLMGMLRFGGSPTVNVLMRDRLGTTSSATGLTLGGGGGTPAPAFTTQPTMSPTSGTAGTTLFTANDGVASNTTGYTRRWLLDGTSIGTGTTVTPAIAGSLVLEVTATGPGGFTIATSAASTVSAAAALTLAQKGLPSVFTTSQFLSNLVEASPGVYTSDYSSALYENTGTMYYVTTGGNDTTGDGSSGTPWATAQKAYDTVPTGSRITFGAGVFAPGTITSKNLSIYGTFGQTIFVDRVKNSDVSSWGTPASGRQAVTLTSGVLSGFVDTTKTRRADAQGRALPMVSQVVTTAAAIATLQGKVSTEIERYLYSTTIGTADPQAGIFRSTPSQIGASDGRDLTNKFDTEIIAWKATAAAPISWNASSQVFIKDVVFVGGAPVLNPQGGRMVLDNVRQLGAVTEPLNVDGASLLYRYSLTSMALSGADGIDYSSGSGEQSGVEIDCFVHQVGATGADNCSTQHGGSALRIGGIYLDASRCWSDGLDGAIIGGFGSTLAGAPTSTAYSLNTTTGEGHYAGIKFITTGCIDIRVSEPDVVNNPARSFFYDDSYVGRSIDLTTGNRNVSPRLTAKDTSDALLFSVDPSQIGTLYQTADTSTPVTAAGQPVVRINSAANSADYALVTAGALTYQLDGGKPCLVTTGTANALKLKMVVSTAPLDEKSAVIWGIKSTDTAGVLLQYSGVNTVGNYTGSSSLTGAGDRAAGKQAFIPAGLTYTVEGAGNYLTGTALKAAAFTGTAHVVTAKDANLAWIMWGYSTGFMSGFDGTWFGCDIIRGGSTYRTAKETAMLAKTA